MWVTDIYKYEKSQLFPSGWDSGSFFLLPLIYPPPQEYVGTVGHPKGGVPYPGGWGGGVPRGSKRGSVSLLFQKKFAKRGHL